MCRRFALPLLFALVTGCATPNPPLGDAPLESIRAGTSTRADVEKLLGRPERFETGANGKSVAFYEDVRRRHTRPFGGTSEVQSRHFSVLYDPGFTVERTLTAAHTGRIQRGWRDRLGQPLDRADVIAALGEPTTREQVIGRFGPATVEMLTPTGGVVLGWIALAQDHYAWGGQERQILEIECDADGRVLKYHIQGTLDAGGPPRR